MRFTKPFVINILFVGVLLLVSCGCEHEKWENATCSSPKTCKDCGYTEGKPIEHEWEDATCINPKTCIECGETEGDTTDHEWLNATCEFPKICLVCNEIEGVPAEHEWTEATCTSAKECLNCGKTIGSSLGHKWIDATYEAPKTCNRCGITSGSPIEKPQIEIKFADSFPSEYSCYSYFDETRIDTIRLTEVIYTAEASRHGYDVKLYFTGEKTYDCEGGNQGRTGKIGYKIYDSDGYVIDDGTYYTPSLRVGEKFRNDEESLWTIDFTPGTYTIEFSSTN